MSTEPVTDRWADLTPRIASAVVMVTVGAVMIWFGERRFHIFDGLIVAVMLWELVRMLAPEKRVLAWTIGALGGAAVAVVLEFDEVISVPVMLLGMICLGAVLGFLIGDRRRMGVPYAAVVLLGGLALLLVRDNLGVGWLLWLICIVVASDVAGYFAGKILGGPKFWPAISPKKTWSGTVAGWLGAGIVGLIFSLNTGIQVRMIALSILLAFAAQLGDIAESAIKRRTGVKDSSNLIPGHGGVLDRFDGVLGAAVALLAIAALFGFPQGLVR